MFADGLLLRSEYRVDERLIEDRENQGVTFVNLGACGDGTSIIAKHLAVIPGVFQGIGRQSTQPIQTAFGPLKGNKYT